MNLFSKIKTKLGINKNPYDLPKRKGAIRGRLYDGEIATGNDKLKVPREKTAKLVGIKIIRVDGSEEIIRNPET